MRRRSFLLLFAGCVAVASSIAGFARQSPQPAGAAQAVPRTVTVEGDLHEPGAMATVTWEGFNPGPAYIHICRLPTSPDELPPVGQCYGETQVRGITGADGTGEAQFEVRSVITSQKLENESGAPIFDVGADAVLRCRVPPSTPPADPPCGVVVSECSAAINATVSARSSPYQLTEVELPADFDPATGGEPWAYSDDPHVTSIPEFFEGVWLDNQYVRDRLPPPPAPPEPPSPVVATGPTIRAVGGDIGAKVYGYWGRAAAGQLNLNFGATTSLDYVAGIDALLNGSADFALSGVRPTAEQNARLTAEGQSLVYVPISVTNIGVGFRAYPTLPLGEFRVSPTLMSGLIDPRAFPVGTIDSLEQQYVAADQGVCATSDPRQFTFYYEPGVGEVAQMSSSWLSATGTEFWHHGVTNRIPDVNATRNVYLSNDQVAAALYAPKQTEGTFLDRFARIGLVDAAWAEHYYLPTAQLKNAAGNWIAPSVEGALATLKTSPIAEDNVVGIDYDSADPAAYPMVTVMYAVAPVRLNDSFTAADAENVRKLLGLFTSDEGQQLADQQGLVPLPDELQARAQTAITKIGSQQPPPPPPPPSVWPNAEVNPSPPAEATTTVAVTGPSTSTPATSAAAGTTTTKGTTATTRPSSGGTQATGATSTTRAATPPGTGGATSTATTAGSSEEQALPPVADDGGPSNLLPPDVFSTMFGAIPFSPGLPTLGAAGAGVAVVGQGIGIWRSQLRRPRLRPPGR